MAYFSGFFLIGMGYLGACRLPSLWSGRWIPEQESMAAPGWWAIGDDAWAGGQRTIPVLSPICIISGFGVLALERGHMTVYWLAMGALAPCLVCHFPIIVWNRPRWAVIPRHRDEPGVAEVRRTGATIHRQRPRRHSRARR